MRSNWIKSPFFIFTLIVLFFFFKFFVLGKIPLATDLLISEYNPWKQYSFLGYNPGSFPSKFQYGDVIHQLYPWKTFTIDSLKNFTIPLWNPYNFSGHPFLADIQSAVFQPLNLLYLILAQPIAWGLTVALQPFIALIGTYLFAKKIGLKKETAIFSSIGYAFSLYMSTFLEYNTMGHVIAVLPITLYGVELILEKNKFKGVLIFSLSIAYAIFAGHIQLAGFNILFTIIYSLFRLSSIKEKFKNSLLLFITFITSLLIASIQLLPTLELLNLAARANQNYQFLIEKLLLQPFQSILFFSPDFFGNPATGNYKILDSYPGNSIYIGLATILFAISSITLIRKNIFIKFFVFVSTLFIILFFRNPLSELFFKINIPFFSTGSPTNAIYLLSFSISILAGFGIENIKNKNKILILISLSIIAYLSINTIIFKDLVNMKNVLLSLLLSIGLLVLLIINYFQKLKHSLLILIFCLITIADLFFYFQKFNSFVPKELVFPDTKIFSYIKENSGINRVWGYQEAILEPNFNTQFNIYSAEGTDPLYPKAYGQLITASHNGQISKDFSNLNRSDAIISQRNIGFTNPYREKILQLTGTKYILDVKNSTPDNFPIKEYNITYEEDLWRVIKDSKAADRIFFAKKLNYYSTSEDFAKKFFNPNFNPQQDILVENNAYSKDYLNQIDNNAIIKLVNYSPNKIIIDTKSNTNQILFISDTYYPGWKATIDNKNTKIIKTNFTFRSIAIPKGQHRVVMSYEPDSFKLGFYLSLLGFAGLFILCILYIRDEYLKKN